MAQSRLWKTGVGATVAGAMAVSLIGNFEGLSLTSYPDVIGVWTACYGETKGIKPGMKFTKAQCDDKLVQSMVEHEQGMRVCLKEPDDIPIKPYISFVSLTYNIGTAGFCKSSIPALLNAHKFKEACGKLLAFNKAGKPLRVINGLDKRRKKEYNYCIEGLNV